MKICIAGGNGFIGRNLIMGFREREWDVIIIERNDFLEDSLTLKVKDCDIIINLAGESLMGLWTKRKKRNIYNSRILTTRKLVDCVNSSGSCVKVFINVSGIGIYDHLNLHEEGSRNFENDFLCRVIIAWEGELMRLNNSNVRVVVLRLGIVLGRNGGFFPLMSKFFNLGLGFTVNSSEGLPFVHIDDVSSIFMMAIEKEDLSGIINVVSPESISIHDFFLEMAKVFKSRIWLKISPGVVRVLLGESSVLLVRGQRVVPKRLMDYGFIFGFKSIRNIMMDLKEGKNMR
jgi:uncharacterized protein